MTLGIRLLQATERNQILDTLTKEVVGINVPKTIVTRTADERWDTAVSEAGNTVGFLGLGYGLDRILKRIFPKDAKLAVHAKKWGYLGSSLAIYSAIFSFMWAMPFIRNYLTTKRTGKVDFSQVIGGQQVQKTENPTQVQHKLSEYKQKAAKILGLGAAGVVLGATSGKLLKNRPLGALETLFKKGWVLKNGAFSDFAGKRALMFWGLPAYGGWIHAARDQYEKKELLLKLGAFLFGFSAVPKLIGKIFDPKLAFLKAKQVEPSLKGVQQALQRRLLSGAEVSRARKILGRQFLSKLGTSVLVLGTLPQLLNIYLTRQRMQRNQTPQQAPAPTSPFTYPIAYPMTPPAYSSTGLTQKPLASWGSPLGQLAARSDQGFRLQ